MKATTTPSPPLLATAHTLPNIPWCSDYEKMISGMLYNCMAPELIAGRFRSRRLCNKYNTFFPEDASAESLARDREVMLREMMGRVGEGAFVEPPLTLDYGCNVIIGREFYANFKYV